MKYFCPPKAFFLFSLGSNTHMFRYYWQCYQVSMRYFTALAAFLSHVRSRSWAHKEKSESGQPLVPALWEAFEVRYRDGYKDFRVEWYWLRTGPFLLRFCPNYYLHFLKGQADASQEEEAGKILQSEVKSVRRHFCCRGNLLPLC